MTDLSCPCHSGKLYSACCEPYHHGTAPETALALMRSRYAAYALGLVDYIINTTRFSEPDKAPPIDQWRQSILEFSTSTDFLGLKIHSHTEGKSRAVVKFTALLKRGEVDTSFTETSQFEKEEGRWLYVQPSMS
jgi:SEC-C motif-containing protein